MSREEIKDKNYRTLGYIETMSDGRLKAMDAGYRTLGYYDPRRNVKQDASYHEIAKGNVLSGLIYDQR